MKVYRIKRLSDGMYSCANSHSFSAQGDVWHTPRNVKLHIACHKDNKYRRRKNFIVEEYEIESPSKLYGLDFTDQDFVQIPESKV